MLKRYYSLYEAAEFLSKKHGEPIGTNDVIDIAKRGKVRICFWYDGLLARYSIIDGKRTNDFFFAGYIEIPTACILRGVDGEQRYDGCILHEDIERGEEYCKEMMEKLGSCERYAELSFNREIHPIYPVFCVHISSLLVPIQDLLALSDKSNKDSSGTTSSVRTLIQSHSDYQDNDRETPQQRRERIVTYVNDAFTSGKTKESAYKELAKIENCGVNNVKRIYKSANQ